MQRRRTACYILLLQIAVEGLPACGAVGSTFLRRLNRRVVNLARSNYTVVPGGGTEVWSMEFEIPLCAQGSGQF